MNMQSVHCTPPRLLRRTLPGHIPLAPRSRVRGLSIVELLVGLTIGLIILAAIGTIYVNVTNMMRQREDQAQLIDPARIITQTLRQDLMQAGYLDIFDRDPTLSNSPQARLLFMDGNSEMQNIYVRNTATAISTPLAQVFPGLNPVFACDGAMSSDPFTIASSTPTIATPLVPACGTANATQQSIRIAYQALPRVAGNASNSLIPADTATGVGLDCLQQGPSVPAAANDFLVINQYFIRTVSGVNTLSCRGSRADQVQDLAAGVEEFVLRYQMSAAGAAGATTAAGAVQSRYLSATDVSASAQGWPAVTAVEICLVSATNSAQGPTAQGTTTLQPTRPTCQRQANGQFAANVDRAAGDNRLWKRFITVVSLRNAIYATPN